MFEEDEFDEDYFSPVNYEAREGLGVSEDQLTVASKIFSIECPDFMGETGEGAAKEMKKGSDDNEAAGRRRGKYCERGMEVSL